VVSIGYPTPYYTDIWTQFNNVGSGSARCGSRHNLGQIYATLINPVLDAWGFNDEPNPCVACHPPHAVQRNYPPTTSGALNTCIRLPSKYKSTAPADLLWGDDDGERMDNYAASVGGEYQPPFSWNSIVRYEPTGSVFDYEGDRTPNYVTLCLECHQYALTDPDRGGAPVKAINWSVERHGAYPSNDCTAIGITEGTTKAPYTDPDANYVLSCLDCHEPHGTYKRLHLIRRVINGELVAEDTSNCDTDGNEMGQICARCHNCDHSSAGVCSVCHGSGIAGGFHGGEINYTGDCNGKPGF